MILYSEIQDFLQANLFSNSYSGLINHEYQYKGENKINFDIQSERVFLKAKRDIAIFKERQEKLSLKKDFLQGDVVELPDGQIVTISHVWSDKVQTSGNQGSLHLHSCGGVSRSGGLDSGLLKSDLIATERTYIQKCWIFHEGYSGAHRGVYFPVSFKLYTVKDGADLSGVPQVEALQKKKLQEQSETITRINGNGKEYTRHMPEVVLMLDSIKSNLIIEWGHTVTLHGLIFTYHQNSYKCQPMTKSSIDNFLKRGNYHAKYMDNSAYRNTLLIYDVDVRKNQNRTTDFESKKINQHVSF